MTLQGITPLLLWMSGLFFLLFIILLIPIRISFILDLAKQKTKFCFKINWIFIQYIQNFYYKKTNGKILLYRCGTRQKNEKLLPVQPLKQIINDVPTKIKWANYLLRHIRLQQLSVNGNVGLGDAPLTALSIGGIYSLLGTFSAVIGKSNAENIHLKIKPCFQTFCLSLRITCILQTNLVHIITGFYKYLQERAGAK